MTKETQRSFTLGVFKGLRNSKTSNFWWAIIPEVKWTGVSHSVDCYYNQEYYSRKRVESILGAM